MHHHHHRKKLFSAYSTHGLIHITIFRDLERPVNRMTDHLSDKIFFFFFCWMNEQNTCILCVWPRVCVYVWTVYDLFLWSWTNGGYRLFDVKCDHPDKTGQMLYNFRKQNNHSNHLSPTASRVSNFHFDAILPLLSLEKKNSYKNRLSISILI